MNGQHLISELTDTTNIGTAELIYIYDLDVFSYYKLNDYDTELKQAMFKKTDDYQIKLKELKSFKSKMLTSTYYTIMENAFSSNYDMTRKGFVITLGSNWGIGTMSARTPKSIYFENGGCILLKYLPSKQVQVKMLPGVYNEVLFFSMSEDIGLKIENDKDNTVVYFFFNPIGKEKTTFQYYNEVGQSNYSGWYNITHNDLKSDKVRIVIANKLSEEIYYDSYGIAQEKQSEKLNKEETARKMKEGNEKVAQNLKDQMEAADRKNKEEKAMEKFREETEAKEKLLAFLEERKSTVYNYLELNPDGFSKFRVNVEQKIRQEIENYQKVNFSASFTILVDTNDKLKLTTTNLMSNDTIISSLVIRIIGSEYLASAYKNNFPVSASTEYQLSIKSSIDNFSFRKAEGEIRLKKGNRANFEKVKSNIEGDIQNKSLTFGKYIVKYKIFELNFHSLDTIEYIGFKGLGGPANSIFSMFIPGLGNQFVNRNKKPTWLLTTCGVGALIGSGFLMNSFSSKNYNKYMNATVQSDIDSYYEMANSQHKLAYDLFIAGGCWWLTDLACVYFKGARNNRESIKTKFKLNLAITPGIYSNGYAYGLEVKFAL